MTEPMFEAGPLLAQFRRFADLSQRELARLVDVPQASVAALESGRRGVRLDVFATMVGAAGMRLAVPGPDDEELAPFLRGYGRAPCGPDREPQVRRRLGVGEDPLRDRLGPPGRR